jgi:glycosyltransferase involved in cell wall biosynthesis
MLPKISIITAVLNNVNGIKITIESLKSQRYKNYEYIIVDSNSTDGTREIIDTFLDQRIFVIEEPSIGIYTAMNTGIKNSTGDLVGILNSGDFLYPGALEIISENFQKNECDYMLNSVDIHSQQGSFLYCSHPILESELKKKRLGAMPAAHMGIYITRNVIKKGRLYDENYKIASDLEFSIYLNNNFDRVVINYEPIGVFHLGGVSGGYKTLVETYKIVSKTKIGRKRSMYILIITFAKKIIANFLGEKIYLKIIKNNKRIQIKNHNNL